MSETNPGVMVFKGLPFAAAPTGDLRWRAPGPVEVWSGVRDATTDRADLYPRRG